MIALYLSKGKPVLFSGGEKACSSTGFARNTKHDAFQRHDHDSSLYIARTESGLPSVIYKRDSADIQEIELPQIGKVAVLSRTELGLHKKKRKEKNSEKT